MTKPLILLALAIGAIPAVAGTFKWVDENGKVQYGDSIPPQYVNRGMTELDGRGNVVRRVAAALTPEQRQEQMAELARKQEEDRRVQEQRRRDLSLIGTYTTEAEIDAARDRYMSQIDSHIRSAESRKKNTQAHITEIQEQLEFYRGHDRATGKPRVAPIHLTQDMEQSRSMLGILDAVVVELKRQRGEVGERFTQDRKRFSEIKAVGLGALNRPTGLEPSKGDRATTGFPINASTQPLVDDCIARWQGGNAQGSYAVTAEMSREYERVDLVLDARVGNLRGDYSAKRLVCTMTVDGKIDPQGTEIKKALASLGARY